MTILVTGAKGQLGTELCKLLEQQGKKYVAADVDEMDITDQQAVEAFFSKVQPTVVYHCAAYTAVDKAEDEGRELNQLINVTGTENVAAAAEKSGATLIYISTDYVFDGTKENDIYTTSDQPNPQNEYGRAKYEGELAVAKLSSKYYIVRTSWVFGNYGANFVFTMQRLAKTNPRLTVVNDQVGRPTWTRTLAEFITFVVDQKAEYGIYHLSNENYCTWYDFACEILKDETVEVAPVDSTQFVQKAHRPKYSVMDLSKTEALGFKIPTWQTALAEMLQQNTEN